MLRCGANNFFSCHPGSGNDHTCRYVDFGNFTERKLRNPGFEDSAASNIRLLLLLAAILVIYSITLTALTGDIGFEGDDWTILGWSYWHQFPGSIWGYAEEFLRPVEGVYWISMFKIFSFNSIAFHLFSLLLLAGSCVLMGACLSKAFPGRGALIVLSVLFAFFLPMVASLTYVVFTDNSRLSALFFWTGVLAFQTWAQRSQSWKGLVPAILLYLLSFLTYEAEGFLIFIVPLLLWPIHRRNVKRSDKSFISRIGVGVMAAFVTALAIRFLLLNGGVVQRTGILPSPMLVWGYWALLPLYLAAPFTAVPGELQIWVLALAVTLSAAGMLFFVVRDTECAEKAVEANTGGNRRDLFFLIIIGIGILFCGMLPYQLAGYGSEPPTLINTVLTKWGVIKDSSSAWFNFHEAGRIYSSASFGLAILLGTLVTCPQGRKAKLLANSAAVTCAGFMVLFHAGLSVDWKEAAHDRNVLLRSLISQVPGVKPKTNFVFFDLESYHKRAVVIRGWAGLRDMIRMLYGDRTLRAWYVYPSERDRLNAGCQPAFVLPRGFVSRGVSFDKPAPHDSLVLLRRHGTNLVWVDKVTENSKMASAGISWGGCDSIHSNHARVIPWANRKPAWRSFVEERWKSGLASASNLVGLRAGARRFFRGASSLANHPTTGPILRK